MSNKKNPIQSQTPTPEDLLNFKNLEKRIYEEYMGKLYIGHEEITPQVREVLREQAQYILTSNFWEIVEATMINEASQLALMQSQEWDHVLSAKQLYYFVKIFRKMLYTLAKK